MQGESIFGPLSVQFFGQIWAKNCLKIGLSLIFGRKVEGTFLKMAEFVFPEKSFFVLYDVVYYGFSFFGENFLLPFFHKLAYEFFLIFSTMMQWLYPKCNRTRFLKKDFFGQILAKNYLKIGF